MMKKIEKDTNTVKKAERMSVMGWVLVIIALALGIWNRYTGENEILQFVSAAAPWVLTGLGIAFVLASGVNKRD